jgi:hypothetical protein
MNIRFTIIPIIFLNFQSIENSVFHPSLHMAARIVSQERTVLLLIIFLKIAQSIINTAIKCYQNW